MCRAGGDSIVASAVLTIARCIGRSAGSTALCPSVLWGQEPPRNCRLVQTRRSVEATAKGNGLKDSSRLLKQLVALFEQDNSTDQIASPQTALRPTEALGEAGAGGRSIDRRLGGEAEDTARNRGARTETMRGKFGRRRALQCGSLSGCMVKEWGAKPMRNISNAQPLSSKASGHQIFGSTTSTAATLQKASSYRPWMQALVWEFENLAEAAEAGLYTMAEIRKLWLYDCRGS